MARQPERPRYFASRQAYYVQFQGKQHLLAVGREDDPEVKEEAWRKFRELTYLAQVETESDNAAVYGVANAFLKHCQGSLSPKSFARYKTTLATFVDRYPNIRVKDLKPFHVTAWIAEMKQPRLSAGRTRADGKVIGRRLIGWRKPGVERLAVTILIRCFSWAHKEGLITRNPIAGYHRPEAGSRGEEAVLTSAEHKAMVDGSPDFFQHVLLALSQTGARPGEVASVTAADLRPDMGQCGAWILKDHKLAKKGLKRVIYLTAELRALADRLNALNPVGSIFRNSEGGPMTPENITGRFERLRDKIGLRKCLTPYSYRHTFATWWLTKGDNGRPGSVAFLVEYLGHVGPKMIFDHYGHLCKSVAELSAAVANARPL